MTDDEHIKLAELAEEYWVKFSDLVLEIGLKAPEHLRHRFLMMLEDRSSCHGSKHSGQLLK